MSKSIQFQLNREALDLLDPLESIRKDERYKGHPHLDYTILHELSAYHTAYVDLDTTGKDEFEAHLREKIEYLIKENKS